MVALRKPQIACPKCQNRVFDHLFDPERWVCKCGVVLASRPSRNLAKGKCGGCGATPDQKPFRKGKNQCRDCYRTYMTMWKTNNKDHIKQMRARPEERLRRQAAVRKSLQRSPEAFLRALCRHKRKESNFKKLKRGHINPICLVIEITSEHLIDLWYKQAGLCATMKIPMAYQFNRLDTVSIDRIDSAKGYVPGNVQLVCQYANMGKRHFSEAEAQQILDAYYYARREREAGLDGVKFKVTR